jgi:hypothetical protein
MALTVSALQKLKGLKCHWQQTITVCGPSDAATQKCSFRCNGRALDSKVIFGNVRDGGILNGMVLKTFKSTCKET